MDQKLDNTLNLALGVPPDERERTTDLGVGYDERSGLWELIIKYSGNLDMIREAGFRVYELLGGYAIVYITEERIGWLADLPEVEYIEKPKQLYFELYESLYASCVPSVQNPPLSLDGTGTIVACIDSGVDYTHPDFRNEDGTTRILELWDQENDTVYTAEQINEALQTESPVGQSAIIPSRDVSGHGTHVLGIAAGNGRASNGINRGVAPRADLIVVKMQGQSATGFPRTTELMRGVDYCVRKGIQYQKPIAINISFGNNYGSHDGGSLLETYLDNAAGIGRTVIAVATGNEGAKNRHAAGRLQIGEGHMVEFSVGNSISNLSIQIWKCYCDIYTITLVSPSGHRIVLSEDNIGVYQQEMDGTELLWLFGEPSPYSVQQEIYLEMIPGPNQQYVTSGVWKFIIEPERLVQGNYEMWMPAGSQYGPDTGFLVPSEVITLTIPSTALNVISVGAYDGRTDTLATFSGRGPTSLGGQKPDLVAPGVNILSTSVGGGYSVYSGTSMAAPFVTGAACLLMEWGIVRGNDPFLYAEKVKAYLRRGARHLPGFDEWPNAQVGYGALCVRSSFPV